MVIDYEYVLIKRTGLVVFGTVVCYSLLENRDSDGLNTFGDSKFEE